MKNKQLLTLGLPVYNGESCIEFTLQSIIDALKNVQDVSLIEILVSDNMSIDKTSEVVNKFINNGMEIKYFCNEKNIGYDGNIDAIVQKASGKYVWFLGCGEKVKHDSLLRLIGKLNNGIEYTNILLDFDIYDERKNTVTDKKIFKFENDILLEGKNNFEYNKYGPAVSSNIVNKEFWLNVIEKPFVVNGWCHIERILNMIALHENSKTLLLTNPYFTLYREKNGWWTKPNSYLLLLLLLHVKVIRSMINIGFSKEVVHSLELKQSRIALLMAIVQSKEYGMKVNKKILVDMAELFRYDYFFWLLTFPLLILPNKMIFIPRFCFRTFNKTKRLLDYVKKIIS